jgi:hypothetical protein
MHVQREVVKRAKTGKGKRELGRRVGVISYIGSRYDEESEREWRSTRFTKKVKSSSSF